MSAIEQSFELAAERCEDLTPLVYAKLFARHPDMEPLFFRDRTGQIRGEMLARTIETILDYVGGRHYAVGMVQAEIVTHEGMGVPRDVFPKFFDALKDTMREVVGTEWNDEMEQGWLRLLGELRATVDA